MIGVFVVLFFARIPIQGPNGAARVGKAQGKYLLNPTATDLATSDLDLVVAGTSNAVLMVESEAKLLSEEVMLGAVTFGHRELLKVINAINELVVEVGTKPSAWQAPAKNTTKVAVLKEGVGSKL